MFLFFLSCWAYKCYANTHQPKHDRYVKYIHSIQECQAQCDADEQCVSYDFIPDTGVETGRCYIQNAGMCTSDFKRHLGATYCEVDHISNICNFICFFVAFRERKFKRALRLQFWMLFSNSLLPLSHRKCLKIFTYDLPIDRKLYLFILARK